MKTEIGAGWSHGGLPPWMERPPGFDEAAAADAAADLVAALHAEWYGPPGALDAEDPTDHAGTYAHRRAVLDLALNPPDHPAIGYGRRRRAIPTDHPATDYSRAA
jgi:hypothetical protein